jgi:hypothetical protein
MRAKSERLVFIYETSVRTNLMRLRGRALRGQRLQIKAFRLLLMSRVKGETLLPA